MFRATTRESVGDRLDRYSDEITEPSSRSQVQFNLGATPTYVGVPDALVEKPPCLETAELDLTSSSDDHMEVDDLDKCKREGEAQGNGKVIYCHCG